MRQRLLASCCAMLAAVTAAHGGPTQYSFIDLHPAALADSSMGTGIGDGQQVGVGNSDTGGVTALLWSGSAATVVDLRPASFGTAQALGVGGGRQVGLVQG